MSKPEKMDVKLDPSAWHGQGWEGLWVEHVAGDVYRVDNIPFYAYGMSSEDEVVARRSEGHLIFEKVSRHRGHSTYRLIAKSKNGAKPNLAEIEAGIKSFGCSFEGMDGRLYAIDVPPGADIHGLYRWLEGGVSRDDWDFEEGHYGTSP